MWPWKRFFTLVKFFGQDTSLVRKVPKPRPSYRLLLEQLEERTLPAPLAWTELGPAPKQPVPETGRVTALAYSPNYNGKGDAALYESSPGGGVWRSGGRVTVTYSLNGGPTQTLFTVPLFAALPTTNLSAGTYVFVATYSGSNNFLGSISSPFTEQINPAGSNLPSGVL